MVAEESDGNPRSMAAPKREYILYKNHFGHESGQIIKRVVWVNSGYLRELLLRRWHNGPIQLRELLRIASLSDCFREAGTTTQTSEMSVTDLILGQRGRTPRAGRDDAREENKQESANCTIQLKAVSSHRSPVHRGTSCQMTDLSDLCSRH